MEKSGFLAKKFLPPSNAKSELKLKPFIHNKEIIINYLCEKFENF